jgi:hypothetical protein
MTSSPKPTPCLPTKTMKSNRLPIPLSPPLTPSHAHNTNKPRAPAVLTKDAKVTKKSAPAKNPVRKLTTTKRTRDESQASHDDDEGQNIRPAKPNITVRQMSKKITKLVEQSDDVAEIYVAFLEWFTKGNGKEVERLREWLGRGRRIGRRSMVRREGGGLGSELSEMD